MNYGEGGLSASDVALINGRNNDNDGFGGNNAWWVILLFLVLGWGRGGYGFGGFGGANGSTSVYEGYVLNNDFSQLAKSISDTYNMTDRKLDGISNGLCSLGYQELQNIQSVNNNISNGVYNLTNAITTNGYETRNAITQDTIANMQNTNLLQNQIAQCCCDNKLAIAGVNSNIQGVNTSIAMQTNAIQNAMCLNTRDIIDNQNANYRAIHEELVQARLSDKEAQIQAQQNEINALRLSASQTAQNAYLVDKLTFPKQAVPAYVVQNPYCNCNCNCNNGCGC